MSDSHGVCLHCGQHSDLAAVDECTSFPERLHFALFHNISLLSMNLFSGVALVTGAASGRVIPFVTTANTDEL